MAKAAKKAKKVAHGTGVVAFINQLIRQGKTNQDILPQLQKKFPESRAGMPGISWCRNKLRKDGEKIKTNAQLRAAKQPKNAKSAKSSKGSKGKKALDMAA